MSNVQVKIILQCFFSCLRQFVSHLTAISRNSWPWTTCPEIVLQWQYFHLDFLLMSLNYFGESNDCLSSKKQILRLFKDRLGVILLQLNSVRSRHNYWRICVVMCKVRNQTEGVVRQSEPMLAPNSMVKDIEIHIYIKIYI